MVKKKAMERNGGYNNSLNNSKSKSSKSGRGGPANDIENQTLGNSDKNQTSPTPFSARTGMHAKADGLNKSNAFARSETANSGYRFHLRNELM